MEALFELKAAHPEAKLVVGNTEVGIEMKFKHAAYPVLIGTTHIPELNRIEACPTPLYCRLITKLLLASALLFS